jgi:hypothetical protein
VRESDNYEEVRTAVVGYYDSIEPPFSKGTAGFSNALDLIFLGVKEEESMRMPYYAGQLPTLLRLAVRAITEMVKVSSKEVAA